MAGNDDLVARLRETQDDWPAALVVLETEAADEIERLRTALADRDATIERLKADHEHEVEDLCNTANANLESMLKQHARATTAERDLAEARAEVERKDAALREARENMEAWAAYASDYFKEKHDLEGDLAKIDAALAKGGADGDA